MITVLTGKNDYALRAALDEILSKAEKEIGDIGIEKIDAAESEVDVILQSVQSLPFLAPSKLVVIYNAQSNQQLLDRIEEVIDRTVDEVQAVLVGPVFDKRKNAFKILKKRAAVHEFNELKPFETPKWVQTEAQRLGLKISTQDATYLVDRIGTHQMTLSNELRKMGIVHSEITRQVIDKLTEPNPQSNIFELLDAAFSGQKDRAITLYREQRKQRVEPQYIVAMLTWQLHNLAMAVFAQPQNETTLATAGQSPFTARKSLNLAQKITKNQLKTYIDDLAQIDVSIKTSADADSALELYLLKLAT